MKHKLYQIDHNLPIKIDGMMCKTGDIQGVYRSCVDEHGGVFSLHTMTPIILIEDHYEIDDEYEE